MILALDLGTTTGYAVAAPSGVVILSGVWKLPPAHPSRAYAALRKVISEALAFWPPDDTRTIETLAYEDVPAQAHSGGEAAHRFGGFEAIVLAAAEETRTPFLRIGPATWKAAAGLRSGTDAADALAAARKRWPGHKFETADEAVARWVAVAAAAAGGGQ